LRPFFLVSASDRRKKNKYGRHLNYGVLMASNISNQLSTGEVILIESRAHWFSLFPFINPFAWIRWMKTSVAVTNKRLIGITGVFRTDSFEARPKQVASATFSQSLFGKIFNYGTMKFTNTGGESVVFKGIIDPKKVKSMFNSALDDLDNTK
jgi:hypothetical protein